MSASKTTRAALVSVGGSPAPVLFTLRQHRPRCVWYFCSAGSRDVADGIHAQLDWHPDRDFIEVERFEELGPCYRALRAGLPALLGKWKVQPSDVLVDYTGGTKTMSAALVLAATELFDQFSYVGGEQREKSGLGVTVDGKERILYQSNPWSDLAIREVERARDLWASLSFDHAAATLREVGRRTGRKMPMELSNLAEALAARHRLDFSGARDRLVRLARPLELLFDAQPDKTLMRMVRDMTDLCAKCAPDKADGPILLRELLDNAIRTASQHRYEDAAARLYRAMEMQGHLWLAEKTQGLFVNGRCKREKVAELPAVLKALDQCRPDAEGKIDLSLERSFRTLHALGDERVAAVVADLDQMDAKGKTTSRWRQATEKRNTSILAHGVQPIGKEGFEGMKQRAAEFLGFDLEREANPVPQLDVRWFDAGR
jgi:CRISPR-associated protein (TIGR02710 family)